MSIWQRLFLRHGVPAPFDRMAREADYMFGGNEAFTGLRLGLRRLFAESFTLSHTLSVSGDTSDDMEGGGGGGGGARESYDLQAVYNAKPRSTNNDDDAAAESERLVIVGWRPGRVVLRHFWANNAYRIPSLTHICTFQADSQSKALTNEFESEPGTDWRMGLRHSYRSDQGHFLDLSYSQTVAPHLTLGSTIGFAVHSPAPQLAFGSRWASVGGSRVWVNMLQHALYTNVAGLRSTYYHQVTPQLALGVDYQTGNFNQTHSFDTTLSLGLNFQTPAVLGQGTLFSATINSKGLITSIFQTQFEQMFQATLCMQLDHAQGSCKVGVGVEIMDGGSDKPEA